ncbi:hypothetical protein B2J88_02900 [Rhodococcus sp. SRB_17]|nr:hypothetical protein [Rhodococcus sp. SRB_17]
MIADPTIFRQVLGQYPTGVVLITALTTAGAPVAMTVGSFTSVSLDPPLVAFLPSRTSASWKELRASGESFCVNVLAAEQEAVCRAVATRKSDKLGDIPWRTSDAGNPVVIGAIAHIDCTVEAIYEAGDHDIVIGLVHGLASQSDADPLLFFRGGYGSFAPISPAMAAGEVSTKDLVQQ